jgi:hypothetical protein
MGVEGLSELSRDCDSAEITTSTLLNLEPGTTFSQVLILHPYQSGLPPSLVPNLLPYAGSITSGHWYNSRVWTRSLREDESWHKVLSVELKK